MKKAITLLLVGAALVGSEAASPYRNHDAVRDAATAIALGKMACPKEVLMVSQKHLHASWAAVLVGHLWNVTYGTAGHPSYMMQVYLAEKDGSIQTSIFDGATFSGTARCLFVTALDREHPP